MKFSDIKKISEAHYSCHYRWDSLRKFLKESEKEIPNGVNLDPDYQRGYVWTSLQKTRYVEWILKGGMSGRDLYFNCPGWGGITMDLGPLEIVDGKQRMSAVFDFLDNKIGAFGYFFKDFDMQIFPHEYSFIVHINNLDRAGVLQWYLDMNSGGSIHTEDELEKVRRLLKDTQ
jgi:hypothetical protein